MMTKKSPKQQESSSSALTVESAAKNDEIIALGRKLVGELKLESSVDTLGKWMAHYLAELITNVENETGKGSEEAKRKCFDVILQLWRHRAELPSGSRPFEAIEPIVRAVESLDPEDNTPRYFRGSRPGIGEGDSIVQKWIDVADGIDYSAKVLIGYCLSKAAGNALDKSRPWVKMAEAAGVEDGSLEIVVKFISDEEDADAEPSERESTRKMLEDRLRRIENFVTFSEILILDLKERLDVISSTSKNDSNDTK